MAKFKIGCQTYTWEMLGDKWKGSVDDILDIISEAGYQGVEITNTMIGKYYDAPDKFAGTLDKRGLEFAAIGFVPLYGWTDTSHIEDEIQNAVKGVDFASHFPVCRFDLAGGSAASRRNLDEKFNTMLRIYNEIAEYASKKGVPVDVHPHSHAGSIIETAEEYERLMAGINPDLIGWCPDTGHIVRGGLDLLSALKKYQNRIKHIHLKDVDSEGKWKIMGQGVCDFRKTLQSLEDAGYSGWVIGEEESEEAWNDQKKSVSENRRYLKSLGY